MAEMSVFANVTVKIQFRTSLPTEGEPRIERQREYADLLNQIRSGVRPAVENCKLEGWEVLVVEVVV